MPTAQDIVLVLLVRYSIPLVAAVLSWKRSLSQREDACTAVIKMCRGFLELLQELTVNLKLRSYWIK